jgi:hypothetical protein
MYQFLGTRIQCNLKRFNAIGIFIRIHYDYIPSLCHIALLLWPFKVTDQAFQHNYFQKKIPKKIFVLGTFCLNLFVYLFVNQLVLKRHSSVLAQKAGNKSCFLSKQAMLFLPYFVSNPSARGFFIKKPAQSYNYGKPSNPHWAHWPRP